MYLNELDISLNGLCMYLNEVQIHVSLINLGIYNLFQDFSNSTHLEMCQICFEISLLHLDVYSFRYII